MKRFSQFLGIHRGKNGFKQAPNAVLVQNFFKGGGTPTSGFNGVITELLMEEITVVASEEPIRLEALNDVAGGSWGEIIVTYDGICYECDTWSNDFGEICYGNGEFFDMSGVGINAPFALNAYLESDWMTGNEVWVWNLMTEDDGSTHTIKIEQEITIPKTEIVITGNETFNFQAANNTVYYKNNDFVNISHGNIVYASCTHFEWGSGAVIADMKDGEFIFNYTKSTGVGTGNISFKKDDLFTSSSVAKAYFQEQVAKGTPVTITVFVKK